MSRRRKDPLRELTAEEHEVLSQIARSRTEPASHVARAKSLLAVADGKTYLLGGTLTAGILIDWFIDNFYKNQDTAKKKIYDLLVQDASASPVGSRGIVVLPHLRGSYTPHNDPHSKGTILGLRTTHNYKDLIRALFEGLSLEFRVILDKYSELTGDPYPEVKCIGGGSQKVF